MSIENEINKNLQKRGITCPVVFRGGHVSVELMDASEALLMRYRFSNAYLGFNLRLQNYYKIVLL